MNESSPPPLSCIQPPTNHMLSMVDGAGGHDKAEKKEPRSVSLAVSADVAQAQIPDDDEDQIHARGGAVAQQLQSMLSHISFDDHVSSLKSELNYPTNTHDAKNDGPDVRLRDGEDVAQASPPPHKEFLFKRMVHAIDN